MDPERATTRSRAAGRAGSVAESPALGPAPVNPASPAGAARWRRICLALGVVVVALVVALVVVLARDTDGGPAELSSAEQSAKLACTMVRQLPADGWTGQRDDLVQRLSIAVSASALSADQAAAGKGLARAVRHASDVLAETFRADGAPFRQALWPRESHARAADACTSSSAVARRITRPAPGRTVSAIVTRSRAGSRWGRTP